MSSLPPFDDDSTAKFTRPPNPTWSWGQKIDSTPRGREWIEGERKHGWKTVSTADEDPAKLYALMISGIVPRPIAFVSTISQDGIENLAPFSWFGMVSYSPPIIAFSCLDANGEGRLKDTTANIIAAAAAAANNNNNSNGNADRDDGFVVSIISDPFVQHANATSVDAPPDVDEWTLSGLTKMPSIHVKPPRVRESAFSMECKLYQSTPILHPVSGARTTTLILAHVLYVHVRNDVLNERGTVDVAKLRPVARLGDNSYGRIGAAFKLPRTTWAADGAKIAEAIDRKEAVAKAAL